MEQITKRDGKFYYGTQRCQSADDAYRKFRTAYHEELGKRVFRRLDKPLRRERVHGFGFRFSGDSREFTGKSVPCRLLGMVGIAYCRIVGCWDFPDIDEEELEKWLDDVFAYGSKALRLVGRKDKAGRTSKLLHKRYK